MGIQVHSFFGGAHPISVSGPVEVYVGQTVQWVIADYDSHSTYTAQASAGTIGIDGEVITYIAPASAQTVTLTLAINGLVRVIRLKILSAFVAAPALTAPSDGAADVSEAPTLVTSAFAAVGRADTHIASRYRVWSADGLTLIYDSGPTTNLTSHAVPPGYLQGGEMEYLLEVAHQGQQLGWSSYSSRIAITTTATLFDPYTAAAGQPMHGGFFVGVMRYSDGDYMLIDGGKASEVSRPIKTENSGTDGVSSYHDGYANSAASDDADHPAAQYCRAYRGGGFTDWYLPARDEQELRYRRLKPGATANRTGTRAGSGQHGDNANSVPLGASYTETTPAQTIAEAFRVGGSEALDSEQKYWTSSQYASYSNYTWRQSCSDGEQNVSAKSNESLVRPVRKVKIE